MHSKVLAALFGLTLVACTGVIDGDVGGEGEGEGSGSGDGSGSGSGSGEETLKPRVEATLDKITLNTELGVTEKVTVTLTSKDGFAGAVTVTPAMEFTGTPGTWTVTADKTSSTLTAGGTDTIIIDVAIPSDSAALTGTLKFDVSNLAPDAPALSSTINVANQYSLSVAAASGAALPHSYIHSSNLLRLRKGAKLIFKNDDSIRHVIHGSGNIPHQDQNDQTQGQPGTSYIVDVTEGDGTWYCHTHNESNVRSYAIQVVE